MLRHLSLPSTHDTYHPTLMTTDYRMIKQSVRTLTGCALMITAITSCSSLRSGAVIQPEADQALRSMSQTIGSAQTFTFTAKKQADAELAEAADFRQSATVEVHVRRPNMVRVHSTSPQGDRDLYYNGKSVTVIDHANLSYKVDRAPSTIDKFVAAYTHEWAAYPPLADLITSAPYDQIAQANGKISMLADEVVDGEPCVHVFCDGAVEDWDVWISKNDQLPRQFDVVYGGLQGSPMTEGTISGWTLNAAVDDAMFVPEIPDGYQPAL